MASRLLASILVVALAAPLSATAAVKPVQSFRTDYAVSFLGFTVARTTFVSHIGADSYAIDGSINSAGLATFFSDLEAKTAVSGRIAGGTFTPDSYSTDYKYGKKSKRTLLTFAKGKIVDVSNTPVPPPRRPDWVPVGAKELQAALDPMTASLIRAGNPQSVCNRTVKAFDGEIRADMVLSYVATGKVSIDGKDTDAVTCAGKFRPVAGYHRSNKSLKYLTDKSRITVKFAQLGQTGIYAPVQASVGTRIGTVSIRARKIETVD